MTKIKACLRYTFNCGIRVYHDLQSNTMTNSPTGRVNHKTLQLNGNTDKDIKIERSLFGERLKDYQIDGIMHCKNGGLLHMETGTGKSFTALTLCQLKSANIPSLWICSKTNIGNIVAEIQKFYPNLPYLILHNDYNTQTYNIIESLTIEQLKNNVLIVTTEHVLKKYFNSGVQCLINREGQRFRQMDIRDSPTKYRYTRNVSLLSNGYNLLYCSKWDWIIVDESHNFRNKSSIKTKALLALYGHKYLCLTGTPIIRDRYDLMTQYVFLGMNPFTKKSKFQGNEVPRFHYATKDKYVEHYNEVVVDQSELQYEIGNLCLANWIDRKEVDPSVTSYLAFFQKMSYIAGCCWQTNTKIDLIDDLTMNNDLMMSPKIKEVQRICSEHNDSSIIIFTSLIKHRTCLQQHVEGSVILGSDTPNRQQLIEDFQQGKFKILITSYAICSEALNFQHANVCILFNPLWNIPQEQQAIARVRRMGQTKPIHIYKMITKNSFDQVMVKYQMNNAINNGIRTNMTLENAQDIIQRLRKIAKQLDYKILRMVKSIPKALFPGHELYKLYRKKLDQIYCDSIDNLYDELGKPLLNNSSTHLIGLFNKRVENYQLVCSTLGDAETVKGEKGLIKINFNSDICGMISNYM